MPVPPGLDLDELKRHTDIQRSADNDILEALLEAAFEQAQASPPYGCGRLLSPDPPDDADPDVVKRVRARGSRFVRVPDAREITEVLADGVAVTGYELIERNGLTVKLELTATCEICEVTGRFGFAEIPVSLRRAIYTLAARGWYERGAQYADQVVVGEGAGVQAYYRQLPPAVKLVFASFTVATDQIGAE